MAQKPDKPHLTGYPDINPTEIMDLATASFISYNWLNSECLGVPAAIFGWQNDTDNMDVDLAQVDDDFDRCRNKASIVTGEECCHSILAESLSEKEKGFYGSLSGSYRDMFPAAANGNLYCHITNITGQSTSNYLSAYFLDDDSCAEEIVKCLNGRLFIYPEPGCQGEPEAFNLASGLANFETASDFVSFQAQTVTMSGGEAHIKWVTFLPSEFIYRISASRLVRSKSPSSLFSASFCRFSAISG